MNRYIFGHILATMTLLYTALTLTQKQHLFDTPA